MTSMKKWISHEPMIRIVDPTLIVSGIVKFATFDVQTVKYEEIDTVKRSFTLPIHN
jgi:hypothetical protein